MNLKCLFVGLGSIGQRHLRNLLSIQPDVKISAVRVKRTVPLLSNENSVVLGGSVTGSYDIEEFTDYGKALDNKPDIVFVTNPNSMHVETAKKALNAGAYVFMEKPVSHNMDGVDELISIEKKIGGARVFVGYQNRFHPLFCRLKKMLSDDIIGDVMNAKLVNGEYMPGWHPYEDYRTSYAGKRDMGGGVLVAQIHDFDMTYGLFGMPNSVYAVGGNLSSLDIDVEDSVISLFSYKKESKNIPVSVSLDYLRWPLERTLSIVGEKGCIDCDLVSNTLSVSNREKGEVITEALPSFNRNDMFLEEMNRFLDFVEKGKKPDVSLIDGVSSLRMATSARDSMELGRVIYFN